jgi:2-oxoglutarate ferredoxin oxidoreductase subunit alpha
MMAEGPLPVGTCADFSWMIGGPQGTGVDSAATLFARTCATAGYWIFGKREYHSNIKGEHSYFNVRVKPTPVRSSVDPLHLLATFENSTADIHADEIVDNGALIYDTKATDPAKLPLTEGFRKNGLLVGISFDTLLEELAQELNTTATKLSILKNALAVAASLALIGVPIQALQETLEAMFTGRRAKLVPMNIKAAEKAYAAIAAMPACAAFPYRLVAQDNPPEKASRIVVNGAVATAMGKLKAGCRFQTYYSITPAVDECIYLEEHPEYGIVVFQCEDELAAVNMAIGAATTGMRASTATSGPGFSLMAEGLGWAGINEVPVVVFNYQRGGPSTGLPTRHEQGELLFAIHTGHGDYPKLVLAPADLNEYYEDAFYAFNYAERYQTPVIVLPDKALANNTQSIYKFKDDHLKVDRGDLVSNTKRLEDMSFEEMVAKYPRFKITDSGVSPRPLPGQPGTIYWTTGDEHCEYGHITEEPEIRVPMHAKRMKKLALALKEIPEERQYRLYGPKDAPLTVVSWGSTKGTILDAMDVLADEGIIVNFLQIRLMSPFPSEAVGRLLNQAKQVVSLESNISGQLAQLIRMRTSFDIQHNIRKWTGRPPSENEVVAALREVYQKQTKEVVLTYGR